MTPFDLQKQNVLGLLYVMTNAISNSSFSLDDDEARLALVRQLDVIAALVESMLPIQGEGESM